MENGLDRVELIVVYSETREGWVRGGLEEGGGGVGNVFI